MTYQKLHLIFPKKSLIANIKLKIHKISRGFVKGRHILDNVSEVQEAIHSSKQRKEKGMSIKLNMANAFDRVNHSFLLQVLRSFDFPAQFISLIKACITNPWIAPLVNGRPTSFFQVYHGLSQGCLLSPFLYILMADSLNGKLVVEMNTGGLPRIRTSNVLNPINHALFADDSLLLGGASIRIATSFDKVLKSYCRASGALINDRKSSIYGWNVNQHSLNNIAQILGFECLLIGTTSNILAYLSQLESIIELCGMASSTRLKPRSSPREVTGLPREGKLSY